MIRTLRKNIFFKIFIVALPLGMVLMPLAASAATTVTPVTAPDIWSMPPGYWGTNPSLLSCTGNYPIGGTASGASSAPNCTDLGQLLQTFVNVIYLAMSISLFIIAPILFLVGAIMIMMAGANPNMLTKGKQTLVGVVVGVIIVLCAYLIVNTVISIFGITGITGFSNSQSSGSSGTSGSGTSGGGTSGSGSGSSGSGFGGYGGGTFGGGGAGGTY